MGLYPRFCRPLLIAFLLIPFYRVSGQVVAGVSADGRIIAQGDTVNVCQGNTVSFRSVGQGSLNISWRFQGTAVTAANGIGPFQLSYNTVGFDTVFQKITGGNYVDSTFLIVQVSNQQPTADFSWAPNGDCGNVPVQFTNLSTGLPLTYSWNFGDGGASAQTSPSYPFLNAVGVSGASSYPVLLSVSNSYGCSATSSHTVMVKNTPDASLGNADAAVQFNTFNGNATFKKCNNIPFYTFSFLNASTTIPINTSYTIQWGDGKPDSAFNSWPSGVAIAHTFPLGSSTMTVKVAGANGCTGIKKFIVFLGSTPAGGLASLGNTDICASDSLRFNVNNVAGNPPGTLYTFLINDGTPAQVFQHPAPGTVSHFFSMSSCSFSSSSGNSTFQNAFGAYLTIENPCGTTSPSVVPIYVSGKPHADMNISPSKTVCTHSSVQIQSTSSYGSVITATGGTGSTCVNSGIQVWTIAPSTGYTLLSGSLGSLNNNPGNGQLWTGGSTSLNATFNTAGVYTVKLYIYNNRCGLDSTTETICVRNPPQASFTMPSKDHCGPHNLTLMNTSPVGACGGDAYDWDITYLDPLGCGNAQSPAYTFTGGSGNSSFSPSLQLNSPGKYAIRLTVAGLNAGTACAPAVFVDTFTIIGNPKLNIQPLTTICPGSTITPQARVDSCYSPGPFTYQWQFTNGTPAGSTDLAPGSIGYAATGDAPLSLTLKDGYCNTSTTANATLSVLPPPVAFAGNETTICSGNALHLGKPAETGVSYHWTPADGLSDPAAADPVLVFDYTGDAMDTTIEYSVVAATSGACSSTATVKVTVRRKPALLIHPPAPVLCIGDTVQLTAKGADMYDWFPAPDHSNNPGDTATVKPAITTTYRLIGQFNGGCPDTATVKVTVNPDAKALFTAPNTTVCSGVNLADLVTVTPDPQANGRYDWLDNGLPIGSNTSGTVPKYTFGGQAATDTIRLITASPYGCKTDSMELLFHIIPGVTAHFTKSGFAGCAPLKIFFNNDSGPVTTAQLFWNFGNGQSSTLQQPDSIAFLPSPYHRDTTYIITLKAYNGCDTTVWKDSVKVYPDPRAAFTVSQVLGCSPFSDTLINLSEGNNTSYYWDFGDGLSTTTTSAAYIRHLYHTGVIDTFTIALSATNRCGTNIDSLDIVVSPATIRPGVLVNGNALFGCAPFTANFVNNSSGAAQITINFDDGSTPVVVAGSQSSISHQYLKAGQYNVHMLLSNSCTDTSISRQVTVFAPPVPAFTLDPNPVCTGHPVLTTNHSSDGNAWLWDWGDGSSSNAVSGAHVFNSGGNYPVRLTASLVNAYGTMCQVTGDPVIIRVLDLIPARIDMGTTKPCAPYNMTVTAAAAAAAGPDAGPITWTFYDDARSQVPFQTTGSTASYQYNKPGNYKVMLVVQNAAGCADTAIHYFSVSATPRLTGPPFGNVYTCNTDTSLRQSATATYTGTGALTWSWNINGEPAGAGNPFEYSIRLPPDSINPVNYLLSAMVTNSTGCADTMTMGTLGIRPLPAPRVIIRPDSVRYQPDYSFSFMDSIARLPGVRYTWDFGDMNGENTGAETSHQYGDTGVYTVKVNVSDEVTGCRKTDTTHVRIVYVPGFLFVPNAICPGCSVGELRQFLPKGRGLKEYHLRIYNAWGQLLFETTKLDANGAPGEPWTARWDGKTVQQDAYRWQIEARYVNGTEWRGMVYPNQSSPVKSGFITVVR